MKTVLYCPGCDYVGAAEDADSRFCPRCGNKLYQTGMDRDAYTVLTSEEKKAAVSLWKYECSQPSGQPAAGTAETGGNGIASLLRVMGIVVYILAGLATIFFLVSGGAGMLLLLLPASGLVLGTMFLGFGEIIRLLDAISKKN